MEKFRRHIFLILLVGASAYSTQLFSVFRKTPTEQLQEQLESLKAKLAQNEEKIEALNARQAELDLAKTQATNVITGIRNLLNPVAAPEEAQTED